MRPRISMRGCVRPSVGHTQVEFLRNSISVLILKKIASGIQNNVIQKTIQRQICEQIARTHLLTDLCQTCFSRGEERQFKIQGNSVVSHSAPQQFIAIVG